MFMEKVKAETTVNWERKGLKKVVKKSEERSRESMRKCHKRKIMNRAA